MRFESFAGANEKGKRSDAHVGVNHVRVSEASRRDADGRADTNSLKNAIEESVLELQGKSARIGQIEVRLYQINRHIRGRRLPPSEYRSLCDEQIALKDEMLHLRTESSDLKVKIAQLRKDLGSEPEGCGDYQRPETDILLRAILRELKKLTKALELQTPAP